jgi:HSP20 family protein
MTVMLMRTDPFRDLDRLADHVFGTAARPAGMPMDAYRTGDDVVIHLDLPGVEPDTIDLDVERNVLTVRAERRSPAPEGAEQVAAERPTGRFSRQIFLGDSLDTEQIAASYDAGVLTVRVPVAEQAKPRKISVEGGGQAARQIAG